MLLPEIPNTAPPQSSFTLLTQTVKDGGNDLYGIVGAGHLSPSAKQVSVESDRKGYYALSVRLLASSIFADEPHLPPQLDINYDEAEVTLLKKPKYGHISNDLYPGRNISYYPNAGYTGNDEVLLFWLPSKERRSN